MTAPTPDELLAADLAVQNEWLKDRLATLQLPQDQQHLREKWLTECGMPAALSNPRAAEGVVVKALADAAEALDGEPEYHEHGMGCGLEDRGITDRYEAMAHGWTQAMERVYGENIAWAKDAIDAALSCLSASPARIEAKEAGEVERMAKLCPCEIARSNGHAMMCFNCEGPVGAERARAALAASSPTPAVPEKEGVK